MITAGLDEVGTGALCGPYIAVVAVFRPGDLTLLPSGVRDSKKTSEDQRGMLYLPICQAAYDIGVGHAWPWEIDELGGEALQLAYRRALADLAMPFDLLYVDGSIGVRGWAGKQVIEPKADVRYREVSAASIVAKRIRDEIMIQYSKLYPAYGWEENKGYGTRMHEDAIRKNGLVVRDGSNRKNEYVHRMRYCKKFLAPGGGLYDGDAVGGNPLPGLRRPGVGSFGRVG